jgi:mono/diheme cytochrome c family protein
MRKVNRWMWTATGALALLSSCALEGVDPRTGKEIQEPLVLNANMNIAFEGILDFNTVVFAENPTTLLERTDFHAYEFEGRAGGVVTITMQGKACGLPDPVIALFGPENAAGSRGTSLLENDDGFLANCFLDAQIRQFRLPVTGNYLIVATSFLQQGGGHYRLTLQCNNNACVNNNELTFAKTRIQQTAIDGGQFAPDDLFEMGDFLFEVVYRVENGMGNAVVGLPGGGKPRPNFRSIPNNVHFAGFGGPEAQSCVSCHNLGGDDGAGDNNHNIFQIGDGINRNSGVPRNPPPLLGMGLRQIAAEEITKELQDQLAAGLKQAKDTNTNVSVALRGVTNPIGFGTVIARPDQTVDFTALRGVDTDLVVKPFGWKGREQKIRRFIEGGWRVHFGMQTEPSVNNHCRTPNVNNFGNGTNCQDPDADGVQKEINDGQMSATSVYLAMLEMPVRVPGANATAQRRINEGEVLFNDSGCAGCHRQFLTIKNPKFVEKGDTTTGAGITVNLAVEMREPRPVLNADGSMTIEAWTNQRRADMGAGLADSKPFNQIGPTFFVTPPLWGIRHAGPWLHDGRAKDLFDATVLHGEADDLNSINAFKAFTADQQQKVIEFMLSLGRAEDL